MNKLERYSLHSGLKISKPFVNDCYYPITNESYITFNVNSKVQSKLYDLWQEVIDLINPLLKENNIDILQIGGKKDPVVNGVYRFCGATNFNQNSYVLKNSLLHFNSCDHFSYLAYNKDVPLVSLFSNEDASSFCFPENSNCIFINSPKKHGCSHSLVEIPKTINKISPSHIAKEILNKLGIKNNLSDYNFIFSGDTFSTRIIEVIPDFSPASEFLPNSLINVRADYHLDENNLFQLSQGRRLGIITDKELSPDFCAAAKKAIARISIDASEFDPTNFLKNLKKLNINYELFSYNEEGLADLRLKHIDEKILKYKKKSKKDLDINFDLCNSAIMNSSKIIISNGKKFPTKAHWISGKELVDGYQDLIDTSDFWEDSDYYIIYNKEETKNGKTKRK